MFIGEGYAITARGGTLHIAYVAGGYSKAGYATATRSGISRQGLCATGRMFGSPKIAVNEQGQVYLAFRDVTNNDALLLYQAGQEGNFSRLAGPGQAGEVALLPCLIEQKCVVVGHIPEGQIYLTLFVDCDFRAAEHAAGGAQALPADAASGGSGVTGFGIAAGHIGDVQCAAPGGDGVAFSNKHQSSIFISCSKYDILSCLT